MRAGERDRLATLRLAMAAIKQREVDERTGMDDTQVLAILDKMIKQRRESIAQYRKGRRDDLAEREEAEIAILQEFLPKPLDESEQDRLIDEAIKKADAKTMADMGRVMGILKPKLQGRADMGAVSGKVKSRLA